MSVNLSSLAGAGWQFFDNNGVPLAGGLLYAYAAGTTTPLATYTTSAGSIANANPIVLDSAGRTANEIWLTSGSSYKFILKTSVATQIGSYDNIFGINDLYTLSISSGSSLIGFIQAGTGAVAETVQTKLRENVSVKDFGAMGDGTTNDTAAIQAAVTYAASVGKNTLIPGGTYLCGDLTIPSNSFIYGEANSIIKRTSDYGWQPVSDSDNITIDTIKFNNNAPAVDSSGGHNYCFTVLNVTVTNLTIRNCKFYNGYTTALTHKNSGPDGIYISNVGSGAPSATRNNFLIDGCTFDGFTRNGISITNGANGVLINNCTFTNNGLRGIDVEADSGAYTYIYDLTIQGCRFINNGAGSIRGTDVVGGGLQLVNPTPATYHSNNVEIIDCYFSTPTAVNTLGISYFLIDSTQNFHMSGCVFDIPVSASTHSVTFESGTYGSQYGLIENNVFRVPVECFAFALVQFNNNQFIGSLSSLTSAATGIRKTISNNLFYEAGSGATSPLAIGSIGTVITNNVFYDDRASLVPTYVIKYNPADTTTLKALDWTISNNVVNSITSKYGFFFDVANGTATFGVQNVRLRGNDISGCTQGIEFSTGGTLPSCFDIDVTDNTFSALTSTAINMNGVSAFNCVGNSITNCATNTIALNINHSDSYLCANNRINDTRTLTARSTYAISAQNTNAGTPTSLLSSNLSRNTQSGFTIAGGEGTSVNNTAY